MSIVSGAKFRGREFRGSPQTHMVNRVTPLYRKQKFNNVAIVNALQLEAARLQAMSSSALITPYQV